MLPASPPLRFPVVPAAIALAFALMLAGCGTPAVAPSPDDEPAPPASAPASAPVPVAVGPDGTAAGPSAPTAVPESEKETPAARVLDPAAAPVVARLAKQLRISEDAITVAQVAQAEWPNGCLGLAAEGEICAQAIVPGFAVSLIANEQRYEFRTDERGRRIRLAFAPLVETGEALVTWKDSASFSVLVIGTERLAFGLRGGPRLVAPPPVGERAAELLHLMSRYAPFYARTAAGEITFRGIGAMRPTPVEQRRIAEWARLVSVEAEHGLPARTDDRAFVWRRAGGSGEFCDEVVVSRSGWAIARPCRSPESEPTALVELSTAELEQLYRWLDTLAPFAWDDDEGVPTADGLTLHLELAGQGAKPLSETERERMLEFSNALVRRLLTDGVSPP